MRIEEYLDTLPTNLLSGEDIALSERSLETIFKFAKLTCDDVFYHLGCGDATSIDLAVSKFHVRRAVGIDNNSEKIKDAKKTLQEKNVQGAELICQNVIDSNISDATVVLFWFTDEHVIEQMLKKFEDLRPGTKIITIWGPLPDCLPEQVDFPYVINTTPFKKASSMQEQLLSVFGVKCIDFVTAWEFAERYTKSLGSPQVENDRFLTIIQTLIIWINAKKLGVSCEDEVPESITTYISIMKMHFDIDFGHLLD